MTPPKLQIVETLTKDVRITLLDYGDRYIPLPLFLLASSLTVTFTYIFPLIGLITGPMAVILVAAILSGDVDLVETHSEEE
jgi:hypothetical protein